MDREPTRISAAMRSSSNRTSMVGGRSPTLQQVVKLLVAVTRKPIRSHGQGAMSFARILHEIVVSAVLRTQQLQHPARVS